MHPDKRKRLIQLLGMLGSDHDGEVLNAARLAQRLIGSETMTWEEVFAGSGSNGHDDAEETYRSGYVAGYANGARAEKEYGDRVRAATRQTWQAFARGIQADRFRELNDWEQGVRGKFRWKRMGAPDPQAEGCVRAYRR